MTKAATTAGFSGSARYVDESVRLGFRRLHESNAFGLDSVLRDELGAVWDECRHPNWDGYDAVPVSQDALRNAFRLLESLPLGCPAPSIGAEPDGHITLDWHRSPRRTLSVSVSPDDELHYAGLYGPNCVYGTEAFFGEIPESILQHVRRVYS